MQTNFKDEIIADVSVLPDGIIRMMLGGSITAEEHGVVLTGWVERSKQVISEQKMKSGGKALCLVDINSLRDFDEGSVGILVGLASSPEVADVNTAVFGGTMFTKMGLKTIIRLTGRKNLRHFETIEAAIDWLKNEHTA